MIFLPWIRKKGGEAMSKYLASFTPYNVKSSLIYITGYESRKLSGYIENPYFPQEQYFDNLVEFLLIMDNLCDEICYPQRATESRSFVKSSEEHSVEAKAPQKREKAIATFKLNILFRQNSSWQGSVLWMEKQIDAQFRSVLELIMLMDSVLSSETK